jgi:hypothetical protein
MPAARASPGRPMVTVASPIYRWNMDAEALA